MSAANKGRVWPLYGWFCGLMTFGSFVGIFTWIARMQQLVNNLEGSELLSQTIQSRTYMGNDLYGSPSLVTALLVCIYNRYAQVLFAILALASFIRRGLRCRVSVLERSASAGPRPHV